MKKDEELTYCLNGQNYEIEYLTHDKRAAEEFVLTLSNRRIIGKFNNMYLVGRLRSK